MENGFLTIAQLSAYLGIKDTNLYAKVEQKEIPYYRIGRLIRFKKEEIDSWVEAQRVEPTDVEKRATQILKTARKPTPRIDSIVKKAIAEVKGKEYISDHGKPDQIKGLRKEVTHGGL